MPAEAFQLLREAVQASWDDNAPSHMERSRYQHDGRPRLALPPGRKPGPAGRGKPV
jgi:hypothetical protein